MSFIIKESILKSIVLAIVLSVGPYMTHISAEIDPTLIGTWSGPVTQEGFPSYACDMTIDDLVIDQVSGQTVYPEFSCFEENVFISNTDDLHVFSETLMSGSICADGRVEIYKLTDNTFSMIGIFQVPQILGHLECLLGLYQE